MKQTSNIKLYFFLFLIAIGIGIYVNSVYSLPFEDDFCYSYKILTDEEHDSGVPYSEITGFRDIIEGQIIHYRETNGRAPVHTLVQVFDGYNLLVLFRIFNSIVFVGTVLLILDIIRRASGKRGRDYDSRRMFFLGFVVIGSLLFLMPQSGLIYYVQALSINYLWSLFASLFFLFIWQRRGLRLSWLTAALFSPLMFLFGWSHEACSLPLAGSLLIYYLVNIGEFRMPRMLPAFFYCVGALMMLLAPGNYARLDNLNETSGVISWIVNHSFNLLTNPWMMLLLAVVIVFLFKNPRVIKSYLRENLLICLITILAALFVFLLGAEGRGFYHLDIFILIVLLSLYLRTTDRFPGRYMTWALGIGVIIMQWMIIGENIRQRTHYNRMISDYLKEESGIISYKPLEIKDPVVSLWVKTWDWITDPSDEFDRNRRRDMSFFYGHTSHKPLITLSAVEMQAMSGLSDYFIPENRVAGSAGFYTTENSEHYILPYDSVKGETIDFIIYFDHADSGLTFRKKLKKKLYGLPVSETAYKSILEVNGRKFYILSKESDYPVKSIEAESERP